MKNRYLFLVFACILMACGSDEATTEQLNDTGIEDLIGGSNVGSLIEALEEEAPEEVVEAEVEADPVANMSIEEAEKKTEMSFCDCVKKQEVLNKKMLEEDDDEAIFAIMDEMDVLKKGECKILTAGDQSSPDARIEREIRVRECLMQ